MYPRQYKNNEGTKIRILDLLAKELNIPGKLINHTKFRRDFLLFIYSIICTPENVIRSFSNIASEKELDDTILIMSIFMEEVLFFDKENGLDKYINDLKDKDKPEYIARLVWLVKNLQYKKHSDVRNLLKNSELTHTYTALKVDNKTESVYFQYLGKQDLSTDDKYKTYYYTFVHYSIDNDGKLVKDEEYSFVSQTDKNYTQLKRMHGTYTTDGTEENYYEYAYNSSDECVYRTRRTNNTFNHVPPSSPQPNFLDFNDER